MVPHLSPCGSAGMPVVPAPFSMSDYWEEQQAARNPKVVWKYLEKNIPIYSPITGKCRLCIREKFNIVLKPELASLNKRTEVFAHCRHMRFKLITIPPDKEK